MTRLVNFGRKLTRIGKSYEREASEWLRDRDFCDLTKLWKILLQIMTIQVGCKSSDEYFAQLVARLALEFPDDSWFFIFTLLISILALSLWVSKTQEKSEFGILASTKFLFSFCNESRAQSRSPTGRDRRLEPARLAKSARKWPTPRALRLFKFILVRSSILLRTRKLILRKIETLLRYSKIYFKENKCLV